MTDGQDLVAPAPAYRPDIDGLRALSVLAVIFFHADVPGFSGGYVGVDVFFVISGYLITLLLIAPSGHTLGRRLADFYLRRGRRILPALLLMLAVFAAAAMVVFLSSDLRNFGRSLAFAVAMLGNVGAWLGGGYYDLGGRFAPLEHLWSIGVEEQFYIAYPWLLVLIGRYVPAYRSWIVAALAGASLALCLAMAYRNPLLNYYASPTRAWQLLLGALVALGALRTLSNSRGLCEGSAVLALITLAAVVVTYDRLTPYPGINAVAPSLAAAALIAAGVAQPTWIGRMLSVRILVFTGLISYSLYLWHAPLLALYRYYNIHALSATQVAVALIALYAVAAVSWRIVERPVRERRFLRSSPAFVAVTVCTCIALAGVGLVLWQTQGLAQRDSAALQRLAAVANQAPAVESRCRAVSLERIAAGDLCSYGPQTDDARRVLVWGDSHAFALLPAYEAFAIKHGVRVYFGTRGACRPVLGAERGAEDDYYRVRCAQFNEAMMHAMRHLNPELVILNAYWLEGQPTGEALQRAKVDRNLQVGLESTLQQAGAPHRSFCAVLGVPVYTYPIPYALGMSGRRGLNESDVAMSRQHSLAQYQLVEAGMRTLHRQGTLRVADPKDVLCSGDTCLLRAPEGTSLYRDATHLSVRGAQFVSSVLDACLKESGA